MLTTEMQKSGRVQSRNTLQKPLFDRLFCVLALFSSIDLVQKRPVKKKDRQTDAQIWARSGGRRARFSDTQNACQPASSSENRSRHKVSNSLNNLINEHLRRTHSLTHLHSLEIAPSAQYGESFLKTLLKRNSRSQDTSRA